MIHGSVGGHPSAACVPPGVKTLGMSYGSAAPGALGKAVFNLHTANTLSSCKKLFSAPRDTSHFSLGGLSIFSQLADFSLLGCCLAGALLVAQFIPAPAGIVVPEMLFGSRVSV